MKADFERGIENLSKGFITIIDDVKTIDEKGITFRNLSYFEPDRTREKIQEQLDKSNNKDNKNNKNKGKKFDINKLRWDLLPYEAIEEVVKGLTYGADKYGDNNWKDVENGIERYFAALMRHLVAWRTGELIDTDSGLPHLSIAACNITMIISLLKDE